jgi:FSR family fosmidomycin resistance protein-like MFS transporter
MVLSVCNFLSKGWEVSLLGLLVFIQQKYSLPLYLVGILSTVFIVCQITISLFAGKIAHAIHSRNVVLLAIAMSGLSWLAVFLTRGTAVLYVAYALGGVASGLFEPIGNSLVAKSSSAKNRGTAIGNFAAFGDMGRIAVGAAATSLAGWLGVNHACAVMLVSNVAAFVVSQIYLPRPAESDEADTAEHRVHIQDLLRNSKFCYATIAGIADSFSSASLYIFIPFLLIPKGIAIANTGYFNIVFFAGYFSGRLFLGRLADKYGPSLVLIASKAIMAALIVFLIMASGYAPLIALIFILGIFTRGTSPIIRAMVADSMDERISFHDAFGAYSFASRGSTAVCRPIYGYLASFAGIASVFYFSAAVSLLTLYPAAKYDGRNPFGMVTRKKR